MTRLALYPLLAAACLAAESLDLSSPELIADGSAMFAQNCAVGYCHGSEGRSARGPALRDRVWEPRELYRVTADGLPGTSMPGWKGILSERDVWAVAAYVLSLSSEPPADAGAVIELGAAEAQPAGATLSAEAVRGKELFFDLTRQRRCGVCHRLEGMGTAIGPNLALAARGKSREDLLRAIANPQAEVAYGFEQAWLELRSGERIEGVLAQETDSEVRIFDAAAVPPPLRTVPKRDVREQGTRERSSMPDDLDRVYAADEIASIVTYLRETSR